MSKSFHLTLICSDGRSCRLCRADSDRGAEFREVMAASYPWDGVSCPQELPIGWDGSRVERASNSIRRPFGQEFTRSPRPPRLPGCGDHLEAIILERGYEVPDPERCGCGELKAKMNGWGPDGCREHMSEIVEALADNAEKLGGWRGWAARRAMPRSVLVLAAKAMVLRAINRTLAQRPVDPPSNGL